MAEILTFTQAELQPAFYPEDIRVQGLAQVGSTQLSMGQVVGQVTEAAANDVQTITISGAPTGGTFGLLIGGAFTTPQVLNNIPYNVTAAALQALLTALPGIGAGNLACAGGPLPGSGITVTGSGALAAQTLPILQVVNSQLTGGTSPAVAVAHTTVGVANGSVNAYNSGNSDGTEIPIGIAQVTATTDIFGNSFYGTQGSGMEFQQSKLTTPILIRGYFNTSTLVGLDSNAVSKFGRLVSGTLSNGVLEVF